MAMTDRISTETIIAGVIRDSGLQDVGNWFDSIMEWCLEAELFIDSAETFERKECKIRVKNGKAVLPRDFYKLISLKIGTTFPTSTPRDFVHFEKVAPNLAEANTNLTPNSNSLDGNLNAAKYYINNGTIYITPASTTEIGISYNAIPLDERGYITVRTGHIEAVQAYCVYKILGRRILNEGISYNLYASFEARWNQLCRRARGNDNMPTPADMQMIGSIMNSLMPLPNKNNY